HAHLTYLKPFPKNFGEMLFKYDKVLMPEMNMGQLSRVVRDKFMIPAISLNKVMGIPFSATEIKEKIVELMK
ncbi:MAG TPA: 2-oxoglutarate ferredoxin oxidoreductase subunit alpha, partial [Bacteroidia bacterium]|nr:2-oxoglutarate ferredoxin oxidoreductase subunit alpha [Bacteroidia bacterium]